jgi:hypothetical protein
MKPGYLIISDSAAKPSMGTGMYPITRSKTPLHDDDFPVIEWLENNIAICEHAVSANRGYQAINKAAFKRWNLVSSSLVAAMDEHPFELLKQTNSIVYRYGKTKAWEHFTVHYSKSQDSWFASRTKQIIRVYDEVLAVQLKLQLY